MEQKRKENDGGNKKHKIVQNKIEVRRYNILNLGEKWTEFRQTDNWKNNSNRNVRPPFWD